MATTKTTKTVIDMPPEPVLESSLEPADGIMFSAPLYNRSKPKGDRTRTIVMGVAGVIAVGAVAAGILLTSGNRQKEVAALDTAPSGLRILAPGAVPAVPLPADTVIPPTQRIITPAEPARPATRVARAAPSVAEAPSVTPSAETTSADVSATVPEPAVATPATPAEAAGALPPAPAEVMPPEPVEP